MRTEQIAVPCVGRQPTAYIALDARQCPNGFFTKATVRGISATFIGTAIGPGENPHSLFHGHGYGLPVSPAQFCRCLHSCVGLHTASGQPLGIGCCRGGQNPMRARCDRKCPAKDITLLRVVPLEVQAKVARRAQQCPHAEPRELLEVFDGSRVKRTYHPYREQAAQLIQRQQLPFRSETPGTSLPKSGVV